MIVLGELPKAAAQRLAERGLDVKTALLTMRADLGSDLVLKDVFTSRCSPTGCACWRALSSSAGRRGCGWPTRGTAKRPSPSRNIRNMKRKS